LGFAKLLIALSSSHTCGKPLVSGGAVFSLS